MTHPENNSIVMVTVDGTVVGGWLVHTVPAVGDEIEWGATTSVKVIKRLLVPDPERARVLAGDYHAVGRDVWLLTVSNP